MIELKNINKIYKTGLVEFKALDNVSLKIEAGEFVAIMGASGSGKSTMLNILGFLDKPDSGTYLLLGKDISNLKDDELSILRNHIAGFVFQQFHLLPRMTALGNAELPLVYAGKRDMKHVAKEKIRDVGLAHRETHSPNEMSGGEQQRVAIARSMVNEPLIVFADEPTGNLDTKSEQEILAILDRLNAGGKTIIMVTHEDEIARHAKRIIRMRDGRIISDKRKGKSGSQGKIETDTRLINEALSKTNTSFGQAEFMDYIRQAMMSIITHKLRSLLSMLGILIGVAAVISMMALGQGAQESVTERLSSLGSNILMVRPGSHRQHGISLEAGAVTRIEMQDAKEIALLKEVKNVSPTVGGRGQLVFMNKNWNTSIQGVGSQYESMRNAKPEIGRFFDESEVRARKKVALVGTTVVKQLFGDIYPVGKEIKINKTNFIVIGVLPKRGTSFFRDQDDIIVVPVSTAMYRLLGKIYLDAIDVEVKDQSYINSATSSIKELIIKRHRLSPDKEDSFEVRDTTEIREMMTSTTRTFSILLGSVAAISLIVGGIGIMNIMLVSVKERTKEIGLRKAIGARRTDILVQFLIESALMTLTGGIAGILLGAGISALLSAIAGWTAKVSLFSILMSSGFSVLVGICFGFYPAVQASRLNPIEALRYE
ncbi:MAG: ABC transporter permease [Spirochaetota bacterium]